MHFFKKLYNLDYVIIRPSNPFGARQNPFGIQGVISVFLGTILKNEPIQIWGSGDIIRDFLYIDDLEEAIYRSIIFNTSSSVFNIASGEGHSLNDLLNIMREVTGKEFTVNYSPERKYDVPEIYLDIDKAKNELNWSPQISLEVGIDYTWNFVKNITQ